MAGVSLRGVMGMADQLGFATRALRVELAALRKVRPPPSCTGTSTTSSSSPGPAARGIVVHDPGLGRRELTFEEASKHLAGVALEVAPAARSRR